MYAEVLVEYTNKAVDKTFTYLVPDNLKDTIKVGMKVKIPFNNKIINGFVLKLKNNNDSDYELKSIYKIDDENLILNKELISLGKHLQECTLCSKITAFQTMLPSSLKVKDQNHNYIKYVTYLVLNTNEDIVNKYIKDNTRYKAQINILNDLLRDNKVLKNEYGTAPVKRLLDLGLIKEEKIQKYRLNISDNNLDQPLLLSKEQEEAVNKIDLSNHDTYLLFGTTGSGKTEVYMHLMSDVIKNNKTCLMLLPEISLTAQMIDKFYKRFGSKVAVFHSGLSQGEKYDEYLKIYRDEIKIVVGTRSAIFTPLKNLGLIVIDEEHSDTYHQDDNPRYNAIDMAKFRSTYNKCPLVLGSATPTLESMARAKKNVYKLIEMPHRINNQMLPQIKIVDMVQEMKKRRTVISEILEEKILDRLAKKEQIILLLNRRGFSTIVTCQNCGNTFKCPHCDITLTYHKTSKTLRCHYCGYTLPLPSVCPECHEDSLNYLGLGTEKLEETLNKMFNTARIVRMDVDTTSNKGGHEKIIEAFKNHEYDILLGTQMIAKGLDFPLVTLVGVINADTSLNIPDFRSGEKTFDLLYQVSGRSGRSSIPGEVIIQTFNPDNEYLNFVKNNSYLDFYKYEMNMRKELKYPPYYYLINITISSNDYKLGGQEANKAYKFLKDNLLNTTIIYSPTPAQIFRVNNVYRFQILIKYRYDSLLELNLKKLDAIYANNNKVNLGIDINPNRF
jgi:primosomal protein N' (replication factor Y)